MKKLFIVLFLTVPFFAQNALCQAPAADVKEDLALHEAAFFNKPALVNNLIKAGYKADTPDRFGQTPLHYAVMGDGFEAMVVLLKNHANPNMPDRYGKTPLHYAASIRPDKYLAELIKPEYKADLNFADKKGQTCLFEVNSASKVPMLAKGGIDMNIKDTTPNENTALHYFAADSDRSDIAIALIENGSDFRIQNKHKENSYQTAVKHNNTKLGRYFSKYFIIKELKFNKMDGMAVIGLCSTCTLPS